MWWFLIVAVLIVGAIACHCAGLIRAVWEWLRPWRTRAWIQELHSDRTDLAADNRRLRRALASARAHEDVVLRENATLRNELITERLARDAADRDLAMVVMLSDGLRAELARAKECEGK